MHDMDVDKTGLVTHRGLSKYKKMLYKFKTLTSNYAESNRFHIGFV